MVVVPVAWLYAVSHDGYLLRPTVTVRQQEDGSFAALGRELPILVLAPTVQELWERIAKLQPSVERMLEVAADGDVAAILRDRGVRFEAVDESDDGSPIEVPVLIRVATS